MRYHVFQHQTKRSISSAPVEQRITVRFDLPRSNAAKVRGYGFERIRFSNLKPGDLVCYEHSLFQGSPWELTTDVVIGRNDLNVWFLGGNHGRSGPWDAWFGGAPAFVLRTF